LSQARFQLLLHKLTRPRPPLDTLRHQIVPEIPKPRIGILQLCVLCVKHDRLQDQIHLTLVDLIVTNAQLLNDEIVGQRVANGFASLLTNVVVEQINFQDLMVHVKKVRYVNGAFGLGVVVAKIYIAQALKVSNGSTDDFAPIWPEVTARQV
jgi:hypothetical protein